MKLLFIGKFTTQKASRSQTAQQLSTNRLQRGCEVLTRGAVVGQFEKLTH